MKDNALYEVVGGGKVPQHRHVLKDEMIELQRIQGHREMSLSSPKD